MTQVKIVVDRDRCMGAAECIASAPDIFDMDENDKAIVVIQPGGLTDGAKKAIRGCPNFAIRAISEGEN